MALYKSNYPELSFYVDNDRKSFNKGEYRTENKKEIEVLERILDATRVDEPKPATTPKNAATSKK